MHREQDRAGQPARRRSRHRRRACSGSTTAVEHRLQDGDGVVTPAGIGELGRQPVVGHEDLAAGLARQPAAVKNAYMVGEVPM